MSERIEPVPVSMVLTRWMSESARRCQVDEGGVSDASSSAYQARRSVKDRQGPNDLRRPIIFLLLKIKQRIVPICRQLALCGYVGSGGGKTIQMQGGPDKECRLVMWSEDAAVTSMRGGVENVVM